MTENETPAEKIQRELGNAMGRELAIRDVNEYIEEQELTRLERYELALRLLKELNYSAPLEWDEEPSRDVD